MTPVSQQLRAIFVAAMTPAQRALARSRINAGERVLYGEDADRLRVHGGLSVELLASGGSETDRSHDEEAVFLVEKLVAAGGCYRPCNKFFDRRLPLSVYFEAIRQATPEEIFESL